MTANNTESNPNAHAKVTQIFEFLKAFASHRYSTVLQITDHQWWQWLNQLPEHESISITQEDEIKEWLVPSLEQDDEEDEGDGTRSVSGTFTEEKEEVIFRVRRPDVLPPPVIPDVLLGWLEAGWNDPSQAASYVLQKDSSTEFTSDQNLTPPQEYFDDDPVRVEEWERWLVSRDAWAETQLAAHRANQIYERLFALHRELEREPETFELMIGDGFLVGRTKTNQIVEHPIILQAVTLRFDPTEPEFRIIQSDASPEAYEPALQALGATPSVIRRISQRVATGAIHPLLGFDTDEFLSNTVSEISADGEFTGNGRPIGDHDGVRIGREAVLFQRRRSAGYARAIDNILEALDLGLCITDPLQRLVGEFQAPTDSDSSEPLTDSLDDLFLTKPANRPQQEIIRLLDRGDQVVVQGPPGTGKTHTIGNVLGHLLEQGKRVLVTSHTTKALEEVRDSVVEDLRPLCVSMLGSEMRHKAELEQAVDHITARLTQVQESESKQQIHELSERREDMLTSRRRTLERLVHAIGGESRPITCEGQERTPIVTARCLRSRMDEDGWIPGSPGLDKALPLSLHEIGELYHTNLTVPVKYQGDLQSALPSPETLLDPEEFKSLIAEYSKTSGLEFGSYKAFWDLETVQITDSEYLSDFLERYKIVIEPLRTYPTGTWQDEILSIGRSTGLPLNEGGVSPSMFDVWRELTEMVERVGNLQGQASASSLQYDPYIPDEYSNSDGLKILEQIVAHFRSGNKLGRITLVTHRAWNRIIKECHVNGRAPGNEEEFDALRLSTEFKVETERVISRLRRHTSDEKFASLDIEWSNDQLKAALEFSHHIDTLLNWHREKWIPIEEELESIGFNLPRFTAVAIKDASLDFPTFRNFVTASLFNAIEMEFYRTRHEFVESTLNKTLELIEKTTPDPNEESILGRLKNAVIQKNEESYSSTYDTLVDVYPKVSAYVTRRDLLERLGDVAPEWANAIREREGIHSAPTPPGNADEAWLWSKLNAEIESRLKESIPDLQAIVEQLDTKLTDITAQLVDEKTWLSLKERLSDSQIQALSGWRRLQARIGKGTGISAPALRRQARELMPQCQSAVPVWIMPLTTLVENFDPAVSKFDCLIVDEASQVDVMGLIPFSMADQVLVVGDDQQVSPEDVGRAQQPVVDLIRQYLSDIPSSALYDGRASIYELADISFRNVIRLTDHFRCVEPIIKFSSDLCYAGELDCLRDSSSVTIGPPTLDLNVKGIYDSDVNEKEAVSIASLMIACDEQPEYAGLTFGMVSMLSSSRQHQKVDELLMRHLSPIAYENRRILCGIPSHFQGGERGVMFLSLVTSPKIDGTPLPRMGFGARDINKKRFNVAASRARDQMWVIHSLEPNYDLRGFNEDLRSRLILHARTASGLASKLGSLQAKARSPFEIEVGERLLSAGYEVEPAWMVGKLEIDLVVLGEGNRKLAIECDGEAYHPPSKLMEDLSRERILEITGGWRFQRIRGSAFYRDPEIAMKPIFERLEREGILPGSKDNTKPSEQEEAYRLLQLRIEGRAEELRQEWDRDDYRAPKPSPSEPNPIDSPNPAVKDIPTEPYETVDGPEDQSIDPVQTRSTTNATSVVPSPILVATMPAIWLLEPYTKADLSGFNRSATVRHTNDADILRMVIEVVKIEGLVSQETVLRRIRETYPSQGRLVGSTKEKVVASIRRAVREGGVSLVEDFFYSDTVQLSKPPRRRGDREISDISPNELTRAINVVRTHFPYLQQDELIKEITTQLGYSRVGSTIRSVLSGLIDGNS